MVHPRVNEIRIGVNEKGGVNARVNDSGAANDWWVNVFTTRSRIYDYMIGKRVRCMIGEVDDRGKKNPQSAQACGNPAV